MVGSRQDRRSTFKVAREIVPGLVRKEKIGMTKFRNGPMGSGEKKADEW